MGYYSAVSIVMPQEDYERMIKKENFLKYMKDSNFKSCYSNVKTPEDFYDDLVYMLEKGSDENKVIQYKDKDCRYISLDYTKWYSEFPEVSYVNQFLKDLDYYQFMRIGEDLDDFEERGCCDYLTFERKIVPFFD